MRCAMKLTAVCLFVVTRSGAAQKATIPRPDTLGANFDASKPGVGTPGDYDFLVGKWSYIFQARDPATGEYSPARAGTWIGSKTHDSMMFEDEFISPFPDGSRGITMTYRVFNAPKKLWEVQGIGLKRGVWQPGQSWADGRDLFLVQDNPERKMLVRIRYYNITTNHFQWRADGSMDGGKTWHRDVMLIEATRVTGS
jgi:hypothetical protein